MKKNDELQVNIEAYSTDGSGVAKPDGFVLFIPGTVKGETVLAHVTKVNKHFGYAFAKEIIDPSPNRRQPLCEQSKKCGGCDMWHVSYDEELSFKHEKVEGNLRNLKNITVLPTLPSPKQQGYRNKAQYPVREQNGDVCVGFYGKRSHNVIECRCAIQPDVFDEIASFIKQFMKKRNILAYNELTLKGSLRHIYLRRGNGIMVCLVVNGELPYKNELAQQLAVQFADITTICINYNDENTNVILGDKYEILYGDGYLEDTLLDKKFRISPAAFYQVNHDGCECLYTAVKNLADVKEHERVLDLYCGIGTIGLCAADTARELVGVEIVPEAVEDAKVNAKINGIVNASFYAADAGDVSKVANGEFDVIIVDPPRKGCDKRTLDFIIEKSPKRLVYVSCDSATLARDLEILTQNGFEIKTVQPVDMFPRTNHVECCVLLCCAQQ